MYGIHQLVQSIFAKRLQFYDFIAGEKASILTLLDAT